MGDERSATPHRIGPRDLKRNVVVVARRDTKEKIEIKTEDLEEETDKILHDITRTLREEAWKKWNKPQLQ